jgi:hypothetical protein
MYKNKGLLNIYIFSFINFKEFQTQTSSSWKDFLFLERIRIAVIPVLVQQDSLSYEILPSKKKYDWSYFSNAHKMKTYYFVTQKSGATSAIAL